MKIGSAAEAQRTRRGVVRAEMRQRKALDIQENGKQFNEMLLWQPSGVSVRGENGNGEFTKGKGLGRLKSYQ